jgi:hypothetical protein
MAWQQDVNPRIVSDNAGLCLRFVQSVYDAPVKYASAWDAWRATSLKHESRDLPPVSIPVWFSHYATYGTPPTYANWGHVVAWFPERGQFLSSPGQGYGHEWLDSIEAVERRFQSTFVGWSEDINGLQVASYTNDPQPKPTGKNKAMIVKVQCADGWAAIWNMNTGEFQHIDDVDEWRYWTEHLQEYMFRDMTHFVQIRDKYRKVFSDNA